MLCLQNILIMVEEAYVSFEIAKLLKEKGFNAEIDTYYPPEGELKIWCPNGFKSYLDNKGTETWWWKCIAPTQQMAMWWLRELHNIKVNVFYSNFNCYAIEYFETNTQTGVDESVFIGDGYKSYEEAVEVALKYCLENLI